MIYPNGAGIPKTGLPLCGWPELGISGEPGFSAGSYLDNLFVANVLNFDFYSYESDYSFEFVANTLGFDFDIYESDYSFKANRLYFTLYVNKA